MNAKSSTLAALVPAAVKTGRCDIRSHCYVRKIATGNNGRVTGAVYFDAQKREVFQRARAVILSANGAETPRLLLQSKSNLFPDGLANTNGNVGKYLLFDAGGLVLGLCDHPVNDYKSVAVTRVLHDFYAADPKRGFYGGGGLDSRMDYYPAGFALTGLPPDEPAWGREWKKRVSEYYTRCTGTLAHSTCLAVEANSISLDDEVKDAWGLPAIRVTFQNHPDDVKTVQFLAKRQRQILAAAGCKKIWLDPGSTDTSYSRHLMGTCRMGDDPQSSVVDRWNCAHDVPNLFIVDGSSLVTSGRQQPTATIQALAYRAAEHISEVARRGEI
ncbi:MAG: GMC family oxidoreductase [Bryobacteraceae bacterium]